MTETPEEAADVVERAQSAEAWYTVAESKIKDATLLWIEASKMFDDAAAKHEEGERDAGIHFTRGYLSLSDSALLLAGISLENALKGVLVSEYPEQININLSLDGDGNLREARISRIGESGSGLSHDLDSLCRSANLFSLERNPILDSPEQMDLFKDVLEYLTHTIRWAGKYPTPLDQDQWDDWEQVMDAYPIDEEASVPPYFRFRRTCFLLSHDLVDYIIPGDQIPKDERDRGPFAWIDED